jgi:hypothetical protein
VRSRTGYVSPLGHSAAGAAGGPSGRLARIVALMMALYRFENQPQPVRLLGWL